MRGFNFSPIFLKSNSTVIKLRLVNNTLKDKTPDQIIQWAIQQRQSIVTTNFRPYEAAIFHACVKIKV